MMRCSEFVGVPGSGAGGAQPFRVVIAPAAALVMDFHAHLNMEEVGGLLSGSYDEATATLRYAPCPVLRGTEEAQTPRHLAPSVTLLQSSAVGRIQQHGHPDVPVALDCRARPTLTS